MKTQIVSFKGRKERVQFKNTPENFENNKNAFEKVAKKNKVELSIRRSLENKYLPQSDAYIILVTRKNHLKMELDALLLIKKQTATPFWKKLWGLYKELFLKQQIIPTKKLALLERS